jgi:two-component system response regulator GlrR
MRQRSGYHAAVDRFRHRYLRRVMRLAGNNIRRAASIAQCSRTNFYMMLTRYAPELRPRRSDEFGNNEWRALQ